MQKRQSLGISFILIFIFCSTTSTTVKTTNAQVVDTWTWISGSDDINQLAVYGDKGVEDPSNRPGARYAYASWIDLDGNYWIFGGRGYNNDTTIGLLNDLWKYSFSSQNWVWMAGSHQINQPGIYDTRMNFSESNQPGCRQHCSYTFDERGYFWIFGGETLGNAKRGDIWCYNITEEAWAWWAGNYTDNCIGNYGSYRSFDSANHPPARSACASWFESKYNVFYVFGGNDYSSSFRNDLWSYSLFLDEWAWTSGSNLTNINGVYGTTGVEDPTYYPGSRVGMASWVTEEGYMWIFGGYGRDSVNNLGYLNDLWRYNITSDLWAYMTGSTLFQQSGSYGTKGLYGATNTPGARTTATSCLDSYGNMMLFSGGGGIGVRFNDLWQYNQSLNEWRWISGNSTISSKGNYGTQGITDLSSYPGARDRSTIQCDSKGEIWMFGGYGWDDDVTTGYLNDLWIYVPLDLVIINEFSKITLIPIVTFVSILFTMLIKRRRRK